MIREGTIEDMKELLVIYRELDELHRLKHPELFTEGEPRDLGYFLDLILDPKKLFLVAEEEGRLIGVAEGFILSKPAAGVQREITWLHIDNIAVLSEFQGRGVGRSLLTIMKAWAKDQGVFRIELVVYEFNEAARIFYEREGFCGLSRQLVLTEE
ncbi:GNAT family N-acetyltransferase [Bacillus coahuilensis]|uniref:GNAT family N-acetyltransferase n=1 Tax=Bacillus coahuilensis TaxID=408580 RepID=UPI00018513A9|nr:GNAT family N-acetyltransferase [Bacillus coahuilensis]